MTEADFSKLPRPDDWGNFWFGEKRDGTLRPAIFPIISQSYPVGTYMASLGEGGILWDGPRFMAFATALEAMSELRKRHLLTRPIGRRGIA